MTAFFPVEKWTRLPLLLGCRPSPANMMPAFTSCSLNWPISASFSFVSAPASKFFVAFTITITRICAFLSFVVVIVGFGFSLFVIVLALAPHARFEHRSHFALAFEARPVLSMQIQEFGCRTEGVSLGG